MWKDYSVSFIKKNRASSISIMAAALIAALCLSFLCSLFYNFWVSETHEIIREEGDWQGRISGDISDGELSVINNFPNVERTVINELLSEDNKTVVDVYFKNIRTIFKDMPLIVNQLGLEEDASAYHLFLLSRYLIHDPQDEDPPMLLALYLLILLIVSFSLILIIHNSFAMSMRARVHQFGILSSIGATPKQILICLMQEAAALCAVPVFLGSLLGILCSYIVIQWMNTIAATIPGGWTSDFLYHPAVFTVTIVISALTVIFSAWLPAGRLSRLTPLEAICSNYELRPKKRSRSPILSLLFGIEGEIAGSALKAQKKALRTSTLSLTLSFLGFTVMLCFFALSGISTNHTYFERFKDMWDVMVTVKDTKIQDFELTQELRGQEDVRDLIVYQKAEAVIFASGDWLSEDLIGTGGLEAVAGTSVSGEEGIWQVKAPVIILEDSGFIEYCSQIGITPRLDGAIILNRIWDSVNSNFRYKQYIPYMKEDRQTVVLQNIKQGEGAAEIPITAYTQEAPVLREEYDNFALVQVLPLSLWKELAGEAEDDMYIRLLGQPEITLARADELEKSLTEIIGQEYEFESENRIEEKTTNDYMVSGYMLILGGFCALLALIGIANVFSNTLGFLTLRKREFAQYMSVGMTPEEMKKLFCIEVLVIAGRPLLITLPLTVAFVGFMIKASYLNPMEFLNEAPVIPILIFSLAIFGFVFLAYYIGGKKVLKFSLAEALRDDTM